MLLIPVPGFLSRLWKATVASSVPLLLVAAVSTLIACGQIVVTQPPGTVAPGTRQASGPVPTATTAKLPTATMEPTRSPTATQEATLILTAVEPTAVAVPAQPVAPATAPCSRPAGTSLPDLLSEIPELNWVENTPPSSSGEDVSVREDDTVRDLETLARECPSVFRAIIRRDWMRSEVENGTWARWMAVNQILQIARVDEASALAVLELSFLDTLEHVDGQTMEFLRDLFKASPDEGLDLISTPDLRDGDPSALPTDFYLLYLRSQGFAILEGLDSLEWLVDGLDPFWDEFDPSQSPGDYHESETIAAFTTLYLKSPPAFLSMVRRPWLQDSVESDLKYTALLNVLDFAYDSPEATAQIASMEFLDTLEEEDLVLMQTSLGLKWDDRERFVEILNDPAQLEQHFSPHE